MRVVGEDFKYNRVFVPEVLLAARAMKAGMAVLKPLLTERSDEAQKASAVIVMGTVKGDLHDIGKNLVGMMAEGAGFTIVDLGTGHLGREVHRRRARAQGAHRRHERALTTTMVYMKTVVQKFKEAGLGEVRLCVGGAPVSPNYAKLIGADGYAADAASAVQLFQRLIAEQDAARAAAPAAGVERRELARPGRIARARDADDRRRHGRARAGAVALRARRGARHPRADLVRQAGQVPRVPGRGRGGGELLSPPAPQERHLEGRFRLACPRASRLERRGTLPHAAARGAPDRDRDRGPGRQRLRLDPAVTRDGRHVLLDGEPLAEADGPLHGLAVDVGTTTVALRLYDLGSGRLVATHSFENPQRFGGSTSWRASTTTASTAAGCCSARCSAT
jgi:5-methyltetrahydrofolate--homocysteine methyltransferase